MATTEVFIRKQGEDIIISPRPQDWSAYLASGPVASNAFMHNIEDPACPGTRALVLRFMLDTDISSYIMRRSSDLLLQKLQTVPIAEVCISVITKAELLYRRRRVSPRHAQDSLALQAYLLHVAVLDFPDEAALHYAQIRGVLKASRHHDWRE